MPDNMEYGLPDPREDADSGRRGVDHEFEWNGEEVSLRLVPPTLNQLQEYQNVGAEADADELKNILDRHIVKPEKDPGDMTMREVNCYIEGLLDYSNNGGGERMQEVREELEQRRGESGNPV